MLAIEYQMWVRKWKCSNDVPAKLVYALKSCEETEFHNIVVLLKLALTLPVNTCGSFSQLKQINLLDADNLYIHVYAHGLIA